jgi:PST family polysaccharide transporter
VTEQQTSHRKARIWAIPQNVSRILRHQLLHNGLALYATQATSLIFPLLTMPYLARVLGPVMFGTLALAQAAGQYVLMVVEYNFNLSATRDVARVRNSPENLGRIFSDVILARVFLVVISAALCVVAIYVVPELAAHKLLVAAAGYSAASQGFNVVCYFLGLERMKTVAILDTVTKGLATVMIFGVVRGPEDAWKVLVFTGLGCNLSFLASLPIALQGVPLRRPSFRGAIDCLVTGGQLFFQRCFSTMYSAANPLILGAVASPLAVAYYSGADKITRICRAMTLPLSQLLFPRLSVLIVHNKRQARREVLTILAIETLAMFLIALALFLGAYRIVAILFGPGYQKVAGVLRILVWILPLSGINTVLGVQWLIPLNRDKAYTRLILLGSFMNLFMAYFLGKGFAQNGIAWGLVLTEATMAITICVILQRYRTAPWSKLTGQSASPAATSSDTIAFGNGPVLERRAKEFPQ